MTNKSTKLTNYQNGIFRITLSKPQVHNAFDQQLISELLQLLHDLDQDKTVRVLILDAEGQSYSAGADLNWMKKMATYSRDENYQDSMKLAELMSTLFEMKCSTIAAVQGAAYGGGVGLVACCDIAISSDQASFCLSEVKLGLIPAVISPYVVKAIGQRAAKRYFMTAERFDANQATQLGLISETVARDKLDDRVMSIAERIIANGPTAVVKAKQLIHEVDGEPIDPGLQHRTAERIADTRASNEGREGVNAFLEKRSANWKSE